MPGGGPRRGILPGLRPAAAEYGEYLIQLPDGERRIKRIILDDIASAEDTGDLRQGDTFNAPDL